MGQDRLDPGVSGRLLVATPNLTRFRIDRGSLRTDTVFRRENPGLLAQNQRRLVIAPG